MKSVTTKNIVYIMGHARSGSTILNILLGNIDGVFSAGEINNYVISGWVTNEYCSCGKRASECEFWSGVQSSIESHLEQEPSEIALVTRKMENWRTIFSVSKQKRNVQTLRRNAYVLYAHAFFNSILERADSNWLVDASKVPMRLYNLLGGSEFEYYVIHMVRDPRAVCYSLNRSIEKNLEGGVQKDLSSRSYATTIKELYISAILSALVKWKLPASRYLCVKHEDVVVRTADVLDKIDPFLGVRCDSLKDHVRGGGVLFQSHNVAGNRLRMQKDIKITNDQSWLKEMSAARYILTSLAVAPLLIYFRYPFTRKAIGYEG